MGRFDIDEEIKKKRNSITLFGNTKDDVTDETRSYPSVNADDEINISNKKSTKTEKTKDHEKNKKRDIPPFDDIKKKNTKDKEKRSKKPLVEVDYFNEIIENNIICRWEIKLDYDMNWKTPKNLKKWCDNRILLKNNADTDLKVNFHENQPPTVNIFIIGKGKDNRCKWCRMFWSSFVTASKRESFVLDKKNTCKYKV